MALAKAALPKSFRCSWSALKYAGFGTPSGVHSAGHVSTNPTLLTLHTAFNRSLSAWYFDASAIREGLGLGATNTMGIPASVRSRYQAISASAF